MLVQGAQGVFYPTQVVLNSASQVNLICAKFSTKIHLESKHCSLSATVVGEIRTNIAQKTQEAVKSRGSDFKVNLEFYLLPMITEKMPFRCADRAS